MREQNHLTTESLGAIVSTLSHRRDLADLIADFVAGLPGAMIKLDAAARSGDKSLFRRECHKLRGEAATYGFPDLAAQLRIVEQTPADGWRDLMPKIWGLVGKARKGVGSADDFDAAARSFANLRILVVDDSDPMRLMIQHFLRALGNRQVLLEASGEAALAALDKQLFGVAIIDQQMPGMSGSELLREMRRRGFEAPAIAISGDDSPAGRQACLAASFSLFLAKPFMQAELNAALRQVLECE